MHMDATIVLGANRSPADMSVFVFKQTAVNLRASFFCYTQY